jgi:hypothetical protein
MALGTEGLNDLHGEVWDDTVDELPSDMQREWDARRTKCWNVSPLCLFLTLNEPVVQSGNLCCG